MEVFESIENYNNVFKLDGLRDGDVKIQGPAWPARSDDLVWPLKLRNDNINSFGVKQPSPSRTSPVFDSSQSIIGPDQKKSFNFSIVLPSGPEWIRKAICHMYRQDIAQTLNTRGKRVY
jgi:hypothetical protein